MAFENQLGLGDSALGNLILGAIPTGSDARLTQAVAEVLRSIANNADLTQATIEVARSIANDARLTQSVLEILRSNNRVYATQVVLEILRGHRTPTVRATQVVLEVLHPNCINCGEFVQVPANQARIANSYRPPVITLAHSAPPSGTNPFVRVPA